ncbi:MAG: hypothetical protein CMI00_10675 [Oceanospirillaceae bacterium]|nr:hypothetical protein [Oceanospirillaceae bacterium]|tara:strand:+ start:4647 stop:5882 length:1236 start_codon:yes stop_codon:yes gene_type:complete
MRIAQVSKADSFGGGASHVAELIHNCLLNRGYFSHHLASWSGKHYSSDLRPLYGKFEKEIRRAHILTKKLFAPEVLPYELFPLKRQIARSDYNLLHFHDLSSAISPVTLKALSENLPLIWTIHDCSAVTAGCLYPMGCEKYKKTCFNCPQHGTWPVDSKLDFSFISHNQKKSLHKTNNLQLVTPSKWMADFINSSGFVKADVQVISNGIDTSIFTPEARSDISKPISDKSQLKILLSSGDIMDERKGVHFALEVLNGLKVLNPKLIIVGNVSDPAKSLFADFDVVYAGYISDKKVMSSLYATASLFLFCSMADNQPLAVMESLSSGTPVYGFETGGIPEMIVSGVNGRLSPQKDVISLTEAIKDDWANRRIDDMSIAARKIALEKFDISLMVDRYVSLYERSISNFLSTRG